MELDPATTSTEAASDETAQEARRSFLLAELDTATSSHIPLPIYSVDLPLQPPSDSNSKGDSR